MCGIIGVIAKPNSEIDFHSTLDIMKKKTAHRGPDDYGQHIGANFAAANLRLSIVDKAGGHQPIYSADKQIGIVYNGEVYNFPELKKDLEEKGHQFTTDSDTEVVLKMYEEYGPEGFDKLNGMFAACIWDNRTGEIYLVRDPLGIKPLYIYEDDQQIIFSSELKGILALPDLNRNLNPFGIQDYLFFRYTAAPYTIFQNIIKARPGYFYRFSNNQLSHFPFYEIKHHDGDSAKFPIEETKSEIDRLFKNSVRSQLMGEVPVGALLSGGIDSSAIAYYLNQLGANLTTFNIGFPEVNEFEYSREIARQFNLQHIEITTSVDILIDQYDQINHYLDEPMADPACLPLYILAKELKKHVTVVLSGEGGDELFAGYPQYLHTPNADTDYLGKYPAFLQQSFYFDNFCQFFNDQTIAPHHLRHRKYFSENTLLNGMLNHDLHNWLPDNLMMKADKILMSQSLEGRFPFLDHDLLKYVSQLPTEYKIRDGITKWILKEIMLPKLPEKIVNRPKMGFTVPVDLLLQKMKDKVLDTINTSAHGPLVQILNLPHIKESTENYYRGDKSISHLQIWTVFTLLFWINRQ